MNERKLYVCNHCGNIAVVIDASGVPIKCCGEPMTELIPNTVDASLEKHVPVVSVNGSEIFVKIGSAAHPMTEDHFIKWVYLLTKQGSQLKYLAAGEKPEAVFALANGDKAEAVYAYCNLHGLWTAKL